jgi:RNA polymerase sigma factor (sigma-70 family)
MPPPAEGFASHLFLGPALRTQPDRRLVTLVREGYEAAFEEIVRRYGRPLGRYAASIVGGRSEDVLQDAFAKALPALRRDDAEIDLRPWLFRIVRNTALNDLRDSPPSPEALAESIAGGRNPAEELECREELADLMQRLQALPEPQRAAIVMRELEGLSHEEIAAALGLTGGGARQAIYRARQALRDGAGMLLPLPLLRLLIDHGTEAAGAGAGGAIAAAGASAGGAGAGGALKLGVVAAVFAGSVGTGVALQDRHDTNSAEAAATPAQRSSVPSPPPSSPAAVAIPVDDSHGGPDRQSESKRERNRDGDGESPSGSGHRDSRQGESHLGGTGSGPGPPPEEDTEQHGGRHGEHHGGDRGESGSARHGGDGSPEGGDGRDSDSGRHGERGGGEPGGPDGGRGGGLHAAGGPGHGGGHGPREETEPVPTASPTEEESSSGSGGSGDSGGSGRSGHGSEGDSSDGGDRGSGESG